MKDRMTQNQKDSLEHLIDNFSMSEVLDKLAEIALDKAAHIETNWQDSQTADAWSLAGFKISQLAGKISLVC